MLAARVVTALSLAMAAIPAFAQSPTGMPALDCKQLAAMPNAPMSVAQCEQQNTVMREMLEAMNAPGGERPADDTLTCTQIIAELKSLSVAGVSAQNRAEAAAAGGDLKATTDRLAGETAALAASQGAKTAAAAVAGGVGVPAVSGAVASANAAEAAAFSARATAEVRPAQQRTTAAIAASQADLTQAMRANPRFGRLIRLSQERQCQVP